MPKPFPTGSRRALFHTPIEVGIPVSRCSVTLTKKKKPNTNDPRCGSRILAHDPCVAFGESMAWYNEVAYSDSGRFYIDLARANELVSYSW